ncbi:MAG: hypothetical protein WC503_04015 [Candidatus Shapirobacteria bacterium]
MDKERKIRKNQVLSIDELVEGEVYEFVHEGGPRSRPYTENGFWNSANYVRKIQKTEDKMKKIIGYGMGIGINPFTGEIKTMSMRAEMDDGTGEVKFFMEKEEEPEVKNSCFLCDNEVEDTREFHLRRGPKDWSIDSFFLCEDCKDERRGRIKVAK